MGSALLDTTLEAAPAEGAGKLPAVARSLAAPPAPAQPVEGLRSQVVERLAEHRSRRARMQAPPATAAELSRETSPDPRAARIVAAVAARYAQQQSYRAFLAAEAERAIQQAQAAAEVAALNAQAIATAQQKLLDAFDRSTAAQTAATPVGAQQPEASGEPGAELPYEPPEELSLWPDVAPARHPHAHSASAARRTIPRSAPAGHASAPPIAAAAAAPAFTVRLYEDPARTAPAPLATYTGTTARTHLQRNDQTDRSDLEAVLALDEEIAFRQAPVFEESPGPPMALPANLIEFPRQLVASRKARPRLAEGPLRDADVADPADGQLRIFEVDPAQISTSPAAAADTESEAAPQWTALWLDAPAGAPAERASGALPAEYASVYAPDSSVDSAATPMPGVAPIGRRLLAAAVNGAIVTGGVAAFAAAFVAVTRNDLPWRSLGSARMLLLEAAGRAPAPAGLPPTMLLGALALAAGFLYVLYQTLFFSLNTATPGMRCARIALCTFDDDNPTRRAMRRRALAVLLSACPLGLGFVWASLDDDRLTWHDRLSRMYQRKY